MSQAIITKLEELHVFLAGLGIIINASLHPWLTFIAEAILLFLFIRIVLRILPLVGALLIRTPKRIQKKCADLVSQFENRLAFCAMDKTRRLYKTLAKKYRNKKEPLTNTK